MCRTSLLTIRTQRGWPPDVDAAIRAGAEHGCAIPIFRSTPGKARAENGGSAPMSCRGFAGQPGPMQEGALSIIVCGSSAAVSVPAYLVWLRNEADFSLRVLLTSS